MKLLFSLFLLFSGISQMAVEKNPKKSLFDKSAHEIRSIINTQIMAINAQQSVVHSVEDKTITKEERTTNLRIYKSNDQTNNPLILFIHGGAWVAGSLDTHDNLTRYLCSQVNATVVSVGYLNAPEGKFPLQLEQCYDALLWSIEHAKELGINNNKIAIVGDSAGGNMAAALCLMIKQKSGPKISLQVLINPAPDLTCNGTLEYQNDSLDILRWQAKHYFNHETDVTNCLVSPTTAKDFSDLPEALILLAENDPLRADGEKYADQLTNAGITTSIYCQKNIGHLAGMGAQASP